MEKREEMMESFQFEEDEFRNVMSLIPPPETGNSFTALLELPPIQAVKLLHSPEEPTPNLLCSVLSAMETDNSPEATSSVLPNSTCNDCNLVKQEPLDSDSMHNSSHIVSDFVTSKSTKRKEREKKVESSAKKIKSAGNQIDGEKLPYVHVRARRGQATDNHSLAERARREKINAKMRFLQELVPGCSKISGTTTVLDEIINHVQALQRQVELLSMELAAVHPRIDINLDNLFSVESGPPPDCSFATMVSPPLWTDEEIINGSRHHHKQQPWHPDDLLQLPLCNSEEGHPNFIKPHISFMNHGSSSNSVKP